MDENSRRSAADGRIAIRVGLLAEPPGRQQPVLSIVDKLGWEAVKLEAWPPVDDVFGVLDLFVFSVERIRQAALATVSDAALDPQLSILVLSDDRNPQTIADVLRCGAHDYLASPFALPELEARMVALVTRVWPSSDRRTNDGIRFDFANRAVAAGPYCVAFTPLEWDVLIALLEHDGQPVTAGQVVDDLSHRQLRAASVSTVISRIRRKLDGNDFKALTIDTVQSRGYIARFRRSSDHWAPAASLHEAGGIDEIPARCIDAPPSGHVVCPGQKTSHQ